MVLHTSLTDPLTEPPITYPTRRLRGISLQKNNSTNRTPAARSSDFVITRMITDRIELHSVLLPLLIVIVIVIFIVIVMCQWSKTIYPFVVRSHVNQFLEKINQPQCLQNYSTAMLDNHTKIMIELQHGFQFIFLIYMAISFGILQKFVELHVIYFICHQCFNNFLEVKPPKKDNIIQVT